MRVCHRFGIVHVSAKVTGVRFHGNLLFFDYTITIILGDYKRLYIKFGLGTLILAPLQYRLGFIWFYISVLWAFMTNIILSSLHRKNLIWNMAYLLGYIRQEAGGLDWLLILFLFLDWTGCRVQYVFKIIRGSVIGGENNWFFRLSLHEGDWFVHEF